MELLKYDIEFQIIGEATQQAISQVNISIGDRTGISDISGLIAFPGFPIGNYEYAVEDNSFQNYYGNLNLTADTSIVIELKWHTGILQSESDKILIYPNPATNELKITSLFPISSVSITDICGKTLYHKSCSGGKNISLELSSLASGLYFIGIENDIGTRRHQEIFLKQ